MVSRNAWAPLASSAVHAATVALAVSLHGPAAPFVLTQRET